MKHAYLIHGWGGEIGNGFFPWLKDELQKQGYTVSTPELPHATEPVIEEQLPFLQRLISNPGDDTILVGHSLGANLILRYLESIPDGVVIGKVVLVAPAINGIMDLESGDDESIAAPWLADDVDQEKVRQSTKSMTAIFSDNDPVIPFTTVEIVKRDYGAKIIIEPNRGHYSEGEGVREVPGVLKAILE